MFDGRANLIQCILHAVVANQDGNGLVRTAEFGANACGAAYAKATGGVFFDTEANEILTAEKALQSARDIEKDLPRLRAYLSSPI